MKLIDVLVFCDLCKSKSEARRLIQQGAVQVDGIKIKDIDTLVNPTKKEAEEYFEKHKDESNIEVMTNSFQMKKIVWMDTEPVVMENKENSSCL